MSLELTARVVLGWEQAKELRESWNGMVVRHSGRIEQCDVTATFEWTELVWKTFAPAEPPIFLILEENSAIVGIMPLYRSHQRMHGIACSSIAPISELYSGRVGLILSEYRPEYLKALVEFLYGQLSGWQVLRFSLVKGSPSESLWFALAREKGLRFRKLSSRRSPYMVLNQAWPEYFATLPKKFRWNLRQHESKLRAAGKVAYREFEHGDDLSMFLNAIWEIEQGSWKETAGTSITANDYQKRLYEDLIRVAAERNWFYGHLLELNGEPIAYVYGLLFNDVFCDLKESFKISYSKLSPGHVLKTFVLQRLLDRKVRIYDYMGVCEPYKMRWTDRTYIRSTYAIYNNSLRGRGVHLCGMLVRWLKGGSTHSSADTTEPEGEVY